MGELKLDLTDLKTQKLVKLEDKKSGTKPHYPVTILIHCRVIDRDIKFWVRWPPKKHVRPMFQKTISLVAAFPPGTQ